MRKVTKLTEFVSKSNKGWGERDYLCINESIIVTFFYASLETFH